MKNLLYIFIGGGTGSLVRYFLGKFVEANFSSTFPVGTLVINIVASLILGSFVGSNYKIDDLGGL